MLKLLRYTPEIGDYLDKVIRVEIVWNRYRQLSWLREPEVIKIIQKANWAMVLQQIVACQSK